MNRKELKEINKPFVVVLNSVSPSSPEVISLSNELSNKYSVPVIPINCLELTESEITEILSSILYRFPVQEISVEIPSWVISLNHEHWLRSSLCNSVKESSININCVGDIGSLLIGIESNEYVTNASINKIDLGNGTAIISTSLKSELFYKIIEEQIISLIGRL